MGEPPFDATGKTRPKSGEVSNERLAQAWDEGVKTALNHAIRNDDGITLRLEHLDGRPWTNPYRAEPRGIPSPTDPRRINCIHCGTPNLKCWERIEKGGQACCGRCHYTECHPTRPDSCPHAAPFVYCDRCVTSPCPLGLDGVSV